MCLKTAGENKMSESTNITNMIIKGIAAALFIAGIYILISGCAAIKSVGGSVTTNNGTTFEVRHDSPQSPTQQP
jgi:hypothetical protein